MRPITITNEMRGMGLSEDTAIHEVEAFQTFAQAVASVAANVPQQLEIERIEAVTANVTVPANIKLRFTRRGRLRIAAGVTVTIASSQNIIANPRDHIFELIGNGAIALAIGGTVYPGWFGALANGTQDDTAAIQSAINMAASGTYDGTVFFPEGVYRTTSVLTASAQNYIGCGGREETKGSILLPSTEDQSVFEAPNLNFKLFKGLTFNTAVDGVTGIKQTTANTFSGRVIFDTLFFCREMEVCIECVPIKGIFNNCRFGANGDLNGNGIHQALLCDGNITYPSNSNTVLNCVFTGGGGATANIVIDHGIKWRFVCCTFDVGAQPWVHATDAHTMSWTDCYFEQGVSIGNGDDYMIFIDASDYAGNQATVFDHCFITLDGADDVNSLVRIMSRNECLVSFFGCFINLDGAELTSDGVNPNPALDCVLGCHLIGTTGVTEERYGFLTSSLLALRHGSGDADTELAKIEFFNVSYSAVSEIAKIAVETSNSGSNFDSSELIFYSRYDHATGLTEAGRIDNSQAWHHGVDGAVRGLLSLWDGAGGNKPGALKMCSPNGTAWYFFVEDDGTFKVHNALPTQNADGTVVGTQT